MQSFIEQQFPVSKVSKESYKERKANNGQTLTGLGKWWGRKPLILVRAAILGCLMPASNNPRKDMEIFLKLMSMDEDGLELRKEKSFSLKELADLTNTTKSLKAHFSEWFEEQDGKPLLKAGVDKKVIEKKVFRALGYDQKIVRCVRPEQLANLSEPSWREINEHLGTSATNLQELVRQLSIKRFGRNVRVGDCFCGGGSIPFEAARMGCDVYASDLNPIAGLLTWADLHICGASAEEIEAIKEFQQDVFAAVDQEICALGIEHNEQGDRAVSYLYCVEAKCPECGMTVPLAPSWVIGKGTKTIARLIAEEDHYRFEIHMGVSDEAMREAESAGTISSRGLVCPNCGKTTPITALRGDRTDVNGNVIYGLRPWEKEEFLFRPDDVYQERLYAIKYEKPDGKRYYRAPNERDMQNEQKIESIVSENIVKWQEAGWIPSVSIESGYNTDQLIRERGWTHWHQLFNPRQLLEMQFLIKRISVETDKLLRTIGILGFHKCIDWNSRLCIWNSGSGNEKLQNTYTTQALNTLFNYGCRSFIGMETSWFYKTNSYQIEKKNVEITLSDARNVSKKCTVWITDPPYADAVNYHELSEFFLAWDKHLLQKTFPDWYTDSKRVLAVKGDENFSSTMIAIYRNLADHMPEDGMQIVMFTHSDSAVWAQLALILWKAGLRVCAAWNIATETESGGLKDGNYIKGTVLLVLRKQTGSDTAFLDEIDMDIKSSVEQQIASMRDLDEREEPNFSDPDYVLAAYAASLKVLTSYQVIEDINLDKELNLAINNPSQSAVVQLIERARKTAYDCIIPADFDNFLWKELVPSERFYLKGLEYEKAGGYQVATYQEYARGFALHAYSQLMAEERANSARLKTPQEFAMRTISEVPSFESSTLRMVLAAIHIAIKEEIPQKGLFQLKQSVFDYWRKRDLIKGLLYFIRDCRDIETMKHWQEAAEMAGHLLILVENDHI